MTEFSLDFLNSLTKYPSIPTYHDLGPRGVPEGSPPWRFFLGEPFVVTEKVDGTNSRVITMPDGDWFIGSREELLLARGDRIGDPSQFIVDTLLPHIGALTFSRVDAIHVVYVETYGHKIGRAGKQYTGHDARAFRCFDVQRIDMDLARRLQDAYTHEPDVVARWREEGQQSWLSWYDLRLWCDALQTMGVWPPATALHVPELLRGQGSLPVGLDEAAAWLQDFSASCAAIDDAAGGRAEGVVVRSLQRRLLVKLRFEDYARLHPTPRKKVAAS